MTFLPYTTHSSLCCLLFSLLYPNALCNIDTAPQEDEDQVVQDAADAAGALM